jgi:hypothetical protein
MPVFQKFKSEQELIANLITGYTNLEVDLLNCVQVVRDDFDAVLKAMFRVRGEANRIRIADGLGLNGYVSLGLGAEFADAIKAMSYCASIRNQFAHSVMWDDNSRKLAIAALEDAADLDQKVNDLRALPSFHVDMPLLTAQESYFCYTDDLLTWVNYQGRHLSGKLKQPYGPQPATMQKPQKRLP